MKTDIERSCGSGTAKTVDVPDVCPIGVDENDIEKVRLGGVGH